MSDKPQYSVGLVESEQLEATMLGHLIENRLSALEELPHLTDDCFSYPAHQAIFRAIVALDQAGIEISNTSVHEQLKQQMSEERATLIVASAASVFGQHRDLQPQYMVALLLDYAQRRRLTTVGKKINELMSDMTCDLAAGTAEVLRLLDVAITGRTDTVVSLSQVLDEVGQVVIDNQDTAKLHTGVPSGLPEIDSDGGLPADGLVIVAARTSHGKTTFAINLAVYALLQGYKVACFSIEMTRQRVASRIVSMRSGVNSNAIMRQRLSPDQLSRTQHTIADLQQTVGDRFLFDQRNTHDVNGLVMMIRNMRKTQGVDMVVIDYAQLVNASPGEPCETDNKLLATLSHKLHDVARELHICILLLSQVNRNTPGMPTISNLRGSGEMEEAADMIILLYNAYHANAAFEVPFQSVDTRDKLQVSIAKNRDGAVRSFLVDFNPSLTLIAPLSQAQQNARQKRVAPVELTIFD